MSPLSGHRAHPAGPHSFDPARQAGTRPLTAFANASYAIRHVTPGRQLLAQHRLELFDLRRRHLADRQPGWSLRDAERLPEIVEAGVADRDADHARVDRLQARLLAQGPHIILPRHRGARHRNRNTERSERAIHRLERNASAGHIPHVGRNPTARPHHARHFARGLDRVGHEADRQRHGGSVEAAVRIGQGLRVADPKFRKPGAGPRARIAQLAFGRIDGAHRTGRAARDQDLGKGAVAAPDVEPAQAVRHREPIEKYFAHETAPTAHPPFVGFAVGEKNFSFAQRSGRSFVPPADCMRELDVVHPLRVMSGVRFTFDPRHIAASPRTGASCQNREMTPLHTRTAYSCRLRAARSAVPRNPMQRLCPRRAGDPEIDLPLFAITRYLQSVLELVG